MSEFVVSLCARRPDHAALLIKRLATYYPSLAIDIDYVELAVAYAVVEQFRGCRCILSEIDTPLIVSSIQGLLFDPMCARLGYQHVALTPEILADYTAVRDVLLKNSEARKCLHDLIQDMAETIEPDFVLIYENCDTLELYPLEPERGVRIYLLNPRETSPDPDQYAVTQGYHPRAFELCVEIIDRSLRLARGTQEESLSLSDLRFA